MSNLNSYYQNNESEKIVKIEDISKVSIKYDRIVPASKMIKIMSSKTAYSILRKTWNEDLINYIEEFKILLLNNNNKVIGIFDVSKGGQTGTLVDIRTVLAVALASGSTGLILSHSHPTGTLKPSEPDKKLTEKIKKAAALMDIKILDHIIVTDEDYYSFADEGML